MKIYDVESGRQIQELPERREQKSFVLEANQEEFEAISSQLGIHARPQVRFHNQDENIRFEAHENYDFLSFIYFDVREKEFVFEPVSVYFGAGYLAVVTKEEHNLYKPVMEMFLKENLEAKPAFPGMSYLYYKFLDTAFTNMFEAMCQYESLLAAMETEIVANGNDFDFEKIVAIKGNCFEVKKSMRLLLYVGDQLAVNDNKLIPQADMRLIRNLDMRINRMYEFAANIHEMSEHLMELYNSTVTSATNDLINKLTIFTVFATPLTLLTGLYGMNFVNMPELQHPYGYFILLGIMGIIVLCTFFILKKIKLL